MSPLVWMFLFNLEEVGIKRSVDNGWFKLTKYRRYVDQRVLKISCSKVDLTQYKLIDGNGAFLPDKL